MKLDTVRTLADADRPFVTVYLDGGTPSGDPDELRLRWKHLRDQLSGDSGDSGDSAPEPALGALDEVLLDNAPGDLLGIEADGRVLVADEHGILLDEPWEANPGAGDSAVVGDIPALGPYVRERLDAVRVLLAVVDRTGATIRRIVATEDTSSVEDAGDAETVMDAADGSVSDDPELEPRQGALSHNRIRRRAEESVKQNARGVADRLSAVAAGWTPDVLLLAGEVQGRSAVSAELTGPLSSQVRETDVGGDGLREEISGVTSDVATARRLGQLQRFEEARVRDRTVEGTRSVAEAADMGAVDTLLLRYGAPVRADGGPDENELLVACARTDAEVMLIDTPMKENVGAVLRFDAPEELKD